MFFLNSFITDRNKTLTIHKTSTGGIKGLFAYGRPVSSVFSSGVSNSASPGSNMREAPLQSRLLARRDWLNRSVTSGSFLTYDSLDNTSVQFHGLPFQDHLSFTARILVTLLSRPPEEIRSFAQAVPKWPTSKPYTTGPISFTKQIAFIKDKLPDGIHYYVFRDEVSSKQPTEWTMWTATRGIAPVDSMLSLSIPEDGIVPTKRLTGNHFFAPGATFWPEYTMSRPPNYVVDVEYYVASPPNPPYSPFSGNPPTIHTMRYGRDLGFYEGIDDVHSVVYEDLLHIQSEGYGDYFVVLFPRKRYFAPTSGKNTPRPMFRTIGKGLIEIKDKNSQGKLFTDYVFLSKSPTTRAYQIPSPSPLSFITLSQGVTTASVLNRSSSFVISLGAEGSVMTDSYGLSCGAASSLLVENQYFTIHVAADSSGKSRDISMKVMLPRNFSPQTHHRIRPGSSVKTQQGSMYIWSFVFSSGSAFLIDISFS